MADVRNIAVLDVGKTNVKVAIVDAANRLEIVSRATANLVRDDDLCPHFDLINIWEFLTECLNDFTKTHRVDGISLTTHGAAVALLGERDLAFPIFDYEAEIPAEIRREYMKVAPRFEECLSPHLPGGQNIGLQIFWVQNAFSERWQQTRWILTYPQYWSWRLTGIAANEITSIGAHTHLWNPTEHHWTRLVYQQGWAAKMAIMSDATRQFGRLKRDVARRLGLAPSTPVACGIHDSNAALLPHIIDRKPPFTVVSTGTWAIAFAVGGSLEQLDRTRDTVANVNVFGEPVPSARFMGGREFQVLTGGVSKPPLQETIDKVISRRWMVLPSVMPDSGPFQGSDTRWTFDPDNLSVEEKTAIASIYLALMVETGMKLIGAGGTTIIEGPFADNLLFCQALAELTKRNVNCPTSGTGTSIGAALLFNMEAKTASKDAARVVRPGDGSLNRKQFASYALKWRRSA